MSRIKDDDNEDEKLCWMCDCGAMNQKGCKCYRCGDSEEKKNP